MLDGGSTWTKAGYAGEDCPKAFFPSYVGKRHTAPGDSQRDVEMADATASSAGSPKPAASPERAAGSLAGVKSPHNSNNYIMGDAEAFSWSPEKELVSYMSQGIGK